MIDALFVWLAGLGPSAAFFFWLFRDLPPDPYMSAAGNRHFDLFTNILFVIFWPVIVAMLTGMLIYDWFVKNK